MHNPMIMFLFAAQVLGTYFWKFHKLSSSLSSSDVCGRVCSGGWGHGEERRGRERGERQTLSQVVNSKNLVT